MGRLMKMIARSTFDRWVGWFSNSDGTSLHDQYEFTKQRPSGFDYLRVLLAFIILFAHARIACYGWSAANNMLAGPLRPFFFSLVPCFFALSGFLVAGSLGRNSLTSFFTLRALRIMPALVVEVAISALVIGVLLTEVPLSQYFSDPKFRHYFLNIVGIVQFELPGVFLHIPLPDNVNGQLWTVPYELWAYLSVGALALFGLINRRAMLFVLLTALSILFMVIAYFYPHPMGMVALAPGMLLVVSALWGVWLYEVRAEVPYSWTLFFLAGAAVWIAMSSLSTMYLAGLPLAYCTIFLGLMNPPRTRLITSGDYSYGLYLYSFPIQQALVEVLPNHRHWLLNAAIALVIGSGCALFSWHCVEKPVLARRKAVTAWVERRVGEIDIFLRRRLGWLVPSADPHAMSLGASVLFPIHGRHRRRRGDRVQPGE